MEEIKINMNCGRNQNEHIFPSIYIETPYNFVFLQQIFMYIFFCFFFFCGKNEQTKKILLLSYLVLIYYF